MRRPLPNLNLLVTFEAAAQQLSFKQAAQELHVTPSAVSQQIQQLEDSLGVKLFERHNRSLTLTQEGQDYLGQIRSHLNGLRRATRALTAPRHDRLRVSVMPPVAARVVLPGMEAFRARHPDVELEVETNLANVDLNNGAFDLAIRYGQPPWPGLSHEKLADVMIQVFTPNGFSERFGLQGNVQAMSQVPLVHMTGRPEAWQQWFEKLALPAPSGPNYYVDDYPAAVQAAETLGAALAIYPVEYSLVQSGRVEAPFPPIGPLDGAIYAVYPENTDLPGGGRAFIDWLRGRLAELPD
ncbi:LysR substrate-binding domain-containing protein [Alcanivorax sp. S6407]|uniref:LysR substrate-binding domain-containing protein n=1 Tax=Alcanivorax sp. S6407 TaxID=2926424 RepID=UPI001FF6DA3B|nr:LysR substrate-binding domain-containing protein [Alcanivorax sp. S6407]MCK0153099.1 LysR substrate-binding domain-containing protein [Alcanivorax sp. S6407]